MESNQNKLINQFIVAFVNCWRQVHQYLHLSRDAMLSVEMLVRCCSRNNAMQRCAITSHSPSRLQLVLIMMESQLRLSQPFKSPPTLSCLDTGHGGWCKEGGMEGFLYFFYCFEDSACWSYGVSVSVCSYLWGIVKCKYLWYLPAYNIKICL